MVNRDPHGLAVVAQAVIDQSLWEMVKTFRTQGYCPPAMMSTRHFIPEMAKLIEIILEHDLRWVRHDQSAMEFATECIRAQRSRYGEAPVFDTLLGILKLLAGTDNLDKLGIIMKVDADDVLEFVAREIDVYRMAVRLAVAAVSNKDWADVTEPEINAFLATADNCVRRHPRTTRAFRHPNLRPAAMQRHVAALQLSHTQPIQLDSATNGSDTKEQRILS